MVFCCENCSYLLWGKFVLGIVKFEADNKEFAKILRSIEQFVQTVKIRTIFEIQKIIHLNFLSANKASLPSTTFRIFVGATALFTDGPLFLLIGSSVVKSKQKV